MHARVRTAVNLDTRAGAALAASVGLHLLALLLWRQMPQPRLPPAPPVSRIVTILLRAPAPAARQPAPAAHQSAPVSVDEAPGRSRHIDAARRPSAPSSSAGAAPPVPFATPSAPATPAARTRTPDTLPARPLPAESPVPSATDTSTSPSSPAAAPPSTDTAVAPAIAQGDAPAGSFGVGLARRQAGRIDRELRGGKSGVPLQADTPWARFRRDVESAHVNDSMSVQEDMYTDPEGVIIYRYRQGNQVRCRRSGSVGLGIAGAGGINDAGWITCPKGAAWHSLN
jgi:hypothetical protein